MHGRHFAARPRNLLAARGQFLHAFGGQAFVVALTLLGLGVYLIEDELANPMQAPAAGLLFAAMLIATAVALLYCLVERKRIHPRATIHSRVPEDCKGAPFMVEERHAVARHKDLPSHHRYTDRACIRL